MSCVIIAYACVGLLAGLIGLVVVLVKGGSLWWGLLAYSLIGSLALLATVVVAALRPERQEPARRGTTDDAPGQDGMRILAVDDDPFILELLPRIAATAGFPEVTTAASGSAALALIEAARRPFDCLLLDIRMPEIDGIDLCARIRRLPAYADVPIIMLTGMTEIEYLNAAFRAGASDYTTKPFDVIDFATRLQTARARLVSRTFDGLPDLDLNVPPAPLGEVPSLIAPAALSSYVARLSRADLAGAYVLAVTVTPATVERADPATFLPTLSRVAAAIDRVFAKSHHLMAYAGEGRFLVVTSAVVMPDSEAIRADLASDLRDNSPVPGAALLEIAVGQAVGLQASRSDRARIAFASALALADRRVSFDAERRRIGRRPGSDRTTRYS
ncbi:response regulator [bacterium]|nr:response regulator [bacterium]